MNFFSPNSVIRLSHPEPSVEERIATFCPIFTAGTYTVARHFESGSRYHVLASKHFEPADAAVGAHSPKNITKIFSLRLNIFSFSVKHAFVRQFQNILTLLVW